MDQVIAGLLSYHTVILMVAVYIVTFIVRRSVEAAFPFAKKASKETAPSRSYLTLFAVWWNQVLLYLIPVVVGIGLAFIPEFRAAGLGLGGTAIYGLLVGWFSSFMYKIFWKTLKARTAGLAGLPEAPVKKVEAVLEANELDHDEMSPDTEISPSVVDSEK